MICEVWKMKLPTTVVDLTCSTQREILYIYIYMLVSTHGDIRNAVRKMLLCLQSYIQNNDIIFSDIVEGTVCMKNSDIQQR